MRKVIVFLFFYILNNICFSLDMSDFIVVSNNEQKIVLGDVISNTQINKLKPYNIKQINKEEKEPPIINYYFEGMIFQTSNGSIISDILITSENYYLSSGLKIGDSLSYVLDKYKESIPDTGNSNEEYYSLLYSFQLPVVDKWKKPEYLLLLKFQHDILKSIEIIYLDTF